MKDNDAILALPEDIKETLWGIALLILGIFLCLIGVLLGGWTSLLLIPGVFVGLAGILYARRGYGRHEVVEKQE